MWWVEARSGARVLGGDEVTTNLYCCVSNWAARMIAPGHSIHVSNWELFLQNAQRKILLEGHRKCFCWLDEWHGLTMDNVRQMEADCAEAISKVSYQANWFLKYGNHHHLRSMFVRKRLLCCNCGPPNWPRMCTMTGPSYGTEEGYRRRRWQPYKGGRNSRNRERALGELLAPVWYSLSVGYVFFLHTREAIQVSILPSLESARKTDKSSWTKTFRAGQDC